MCFFGHLACCTFFRVVLHILCLLGDMKSNEVNAKDAYVIPVLLGYRNPACCVLSAGHRLTSVSLDRESQSHAQNQSSSISSDFAGALPEPE